jgi:hypothetical protein
MRDFPAWPIEGRSLVEPDPELELVLDPQHPTLDNERFADQILELSNALKAELDGTSVQTMPEIGKRGGSTQLLLALGTSRAITAAVAVCKAWLDRDTARRIRVKILTRRTSQEIDIIADAANVAELEKLLVVARAK